MNANLDMFLDSLGWALLHSLWQIAAIAAIVWLALRIVSDRKPATRFAIAYCGMIASLGAFLITFLGYFGFATPEAAATAAPLAATMPAAGPVEWLGQATWGISLIWSLGFAALSLRYVRALRQTYRLRNEGVMPVPEFWERNFALWVARVGVDPRTAIRQTPHVSSPVTIGALKPIVLVPVGFFLHLSREQAEAILLHELAHICRQDYILGLIEEVVKTVFFFHPCIFWLSRRIDAEREYACDEFVLAETGDPRTLAQGLGRIALGSRGERAGFAMAANGGAVPVLDRIRRLTGAPVARNDGSAGLATAISLMLLSASCLVAVGADASSPAPAAKDESEAREIASADRMSEWPHRAWEAAHTADDDHIAPRVMPSSATPAMLPPMPVAKPAAPASKAAPGGEWADFTPSAIPLRAVASVGPIQAGLRFAVARQVSPGAPMMLPAQAAAHGDWEGFAERIAAIAEAACPDGETIVAAVEAGLDRERAGRDAERMAERIAARAEAHAARAEALAEAHAERAEAHAARAEARAEAHAARAEAIAERRSTRIAALATRMADRRVRAAHARDEAETDRLDREADAIERELEREAEAMEAEIESSFADWT